MGIFYCMFVSKWFPMTGIRVRISPKALTSKLLDACRNDHFYVYLVPMILPVGLIFIVLNWMGLKLFRHN
jgi:hypothetical protein